MLFCGHTDWEILVDSGVHSLWLTMQHARQFWGVLQVMLELTQQSLAFQQERSQLTGMLHAQHESMQQLVEETQTQEAALQGLSQHAQEADQQVRQGITPL